MLGALARGVLLPSRPAALSRQPSIYEKAVGRTIRTWAPRLAITARLPTSLGLAFSKDQENTACPWLGYELNVAIGRHQDNPLHATHPVKIAVLSGNLVVTLPGRNP